MPRRLPAHRSSSSFLQKLHLRVRSLCAAWAALPGKVHRDERGTVSIMTVFALFMFTILLVQVVNVGRHADDRIRMQNAADGAAWSGGVVLARTMNALAFANHLEAEVFALTAYMRTAAQRADNNQPAVQSLTPDILSKWEEVGQVFEQFGGSAGYEKFRRLGRAIQDKVPLERNVVQAFSDMAARHAEMTLPVLEYILHAGENNPTGGPGPSNYGQPVNVPEGGLLPRFQRALVQSAPLLASLAADETARRYGRPGERLRRDNVPLQGRLWRTDAVCLSAGDESDPLTRTIPAIDPSPTGRDGPPSLNYYNIARRQRRLLAQRYLEFWIQDWMGPYFSYAAGLNGQNRPGRDTAKMSQFINLWRSFACGHLMILLDAEYREINLPFVIRSAGGDEQQALERNHHFVAVAYGTHIGEMFPGLFRNPLQREGQSDAQTFAQVSIFIPRPRHLCCPWARVRVVTQPDGTRKVVCSPHMEGWPQSWNLLNQNWTCKLVPATSDAVVSILQQGPPDLSGFRPLKLSGISPDDIRKVNKH